MRGLAVIVLVIAGAGCYQPHPVEGARCTASLECPTPLSCSHGVCVRDPGDAGGSDAAACTPIANGAGALTAPRLTTPIVLDGNLADWPTCFVALDATDAGALNDLGANGMFPSGRFALAHDDTSLYLAAEVTGVAPLGDHAVPDNYKNDAISIYFDGDGVFTTAAYDTNAAQIVVDHANRVQGFRSGSLLALSSYTSMVRTAQATYTIELKIAPSTIGATRFASTIGFDIGFVDGDGVDQLSEVVWYQRCAPPACGCSSGVAFPYCDAREFGTVTLAP